jgi:Raf kinase inhibitor-like YbhB/YbcL family protein
MAIVTGIALAGCKKVETAEHTPTATSQVSQGDKQMSSLTMTSTAFAHNGTIPRKHSGDGQDISPPLNWSGLPAGAKELAMIVDDPDAPTPQPWVHWVLYRIPPETKGLPEGVAPSLHGPGSMLQGKNSWNKVGYGGPAPPRGHGLHHYHFRLYALDAPLNLEPGLTKDAVVKAMTGHILAEGVLTGTFQR